MYVWIIDESTNAFKILNTKVWFILPFRVESIELNQSFTCSKPKKKPPPISIGCLCKIWLHNCIMDIMKIISLLFKSYKSKELIRRMLTIYTCVMYLWLSWFSCACMIIDWNSGKSNFCRLLGNRFGLCNIHSQLPGERQMILTRNSLCISVFSP